MTPAGGWRLAFMAGYLGEFVLLLVWYGRIAPDTAPIGYLFLLLPLLALLPGLWRGSRYVAAVSLFLATGYFTHGVIEAWSNAAVRGLALAEVALTVLWFVAGILYIRHSRAMR